MRRECRNCGRLCKQVLVVWAADCRRSGLPTESKQWRDFCSKSCYCNYESHGRTPWREMCPWCYGPPKDMRLRLDAHQRKERR